MQQASHICKAAPQAALRSRNRPASKQSAVSSGLSCSGRLRLRGLPGDAYVQRASLRGGGRGAKSKWHDSEQPAPRSRWMLTELLTEMPDPSNVLLQERRGQLLTLQQQATNLCSPQTCSCLLMVVVLPPPLPADQSGTQQSR